MLRDFSTEKFDIIIQGGQSNSQGCGLGMATEPFTPCPEILYLNNDFTIDTARELVEGNDIRGEYSLTFCSEYIKSGKLLPGRKLLVLRAAVGGTGFLDNRWKPQDDLFLTMIDMIRTSVELNKENKPVAFLWHQGETDATLNAEKQSHFEHLSTLLKLVREEVKMENLPFIAGDFVQQWKASNISICEPVIEAIKEVCNVSGYSSFVETDGLESNDQRIHNDDTIHFSREALNILGKRYFEAFCKIK